MFRVTRIQKKKKKEKPALPFPFPLPLPPPFPLLLLLLGFPLVLIAHTFRIARIWLIIYFQLISGFLPLLLLLSYSFAAAQRQVSIFSSQTKAFRGLSTEHTHSLAHRSSHTHRSKHTHTLRHIHTQRQCTECSPR